MRPIGCVSFLLLAILCGGPARAACTFGTSSEPSLQDVFGSILGGGAPSATNDCLANDSVWTAPGQVVATVIIEIAGFSGSNMFGVYDPLHPLQQATVFDGADSAGATSTIQLVGNGSGYNVMVDNMLATTFASTSFGFFLDTPQNNTFFSQATLNGDAADHLYSYQGSGQPFTGGPLAGSSFATSMYLLAFEDLLMPQSDQDYQDFVAAVNYASPIPVPGAILLLGSVLVVLGSRLRRAVRVCLPA